MKKIFLAGALILACAANAQEIKPTTGDVTTEFGLTGGLLNTNFNLNDTDKFFKARYFKTDKLAYRASFTLNTTSNKDNVDFLTAEGSSAETHTTGKNVANTSHFLLGFGVEKHFNGTDRLSPYIGAEALIGYKSSKGTYDVTTVNSGSNTTSSSIATKTVAKGPNTFNFGVRGVLGADYYFAKKVFLGVEAGLELMYGSIGKTTTTTDISSANNSSSTTTTTAHGGSSFNISSKLITGVRVGFVF